ncbi:MAG TPA: hypothetical protein VF173_05055 [Thermoanaerobaculia bacterium]|nr:hypothetical protein [Thermoanaerobaculia bacterium]
MKIRRTVPALLVLASLAALYTTGCCWDPHRRHDRRLEVNLAVPSAAQMEVAAR